MGVPIKQALKVGMYIFKQKLKKRKKYPLVLMLEPLFRCNLACVGCGKIQKTNEILKKFLTPQQCFDAANECDAPIVSIAGGEPLIYPHIVEVVEGLIAQKRYVYLCTNAILLDKYLPKLPVSPFLTLSIHLDGMEEDHDRIVVQDGVWKTAVAAIRKGLKMGFRVTSNSTFFNDMTVEKAKKFFDFLSPLGMDGMTVASAFQYHDAPEQDIFYARNRTHEFFKELLSHNGKNGHKWSFNHSPLYLEFLEGKQDFECTPWGNPNYSVLGWQKPCYLLDEGYTDSFEKLIEETKWENYGHKNHPQCANCTAHCGYEATAVEASTHGIKNMFMSAKSIFQ